MGIVRTHSGCSFILSSEVLVGGNRIIPVTYSVHVRVDGLVYWDRQTVVSKPYRSDQHSNDPLASVLAMGAIKPDDNYQVEQNIFLQIQSIIIKIMVATMAK